LGLAQDNPTVLRSAYEYLLKWNKHELSYIGILTDKPEGVLQVADFIDAKPGQKRVMATYPLNEWFPADLLSLIDRFFNVDFDMTLKRARARQNAITVKAEHLMSAGLW
jgi:hypothetical protein